MNIGHGPQMRRNAIRVLVVLLAGRAGHGGGRRAERRGRLMHVRPRRTHVGALVVATVVVALPIVTGSRAAATESAVTAATSTGVSAEQRFVPGVVGAFNALSTRADALAFRRGVTPEAGLCKHYQGVARKEGPDGTPYLIMTKSGNVPSGCGAFVDDAPGYLIVARMGSREKHGERLRTNLLPHGQPLDTGLAVDVGVVAIPLDGQGGWPAYRHPGGMQLLGDVLAIGAENPFADEDPSNRAVVLFVDVSDPENPIFLTRFDPPDLEGAGNAEFGADPVGLTAIRAADGACCRYLLIVAGGPDNKEARFFRSLPDAGRTTSDLKSPALSWEQVGRYSESQIESCLGADWPTGTPVQHQMLNLVRQGDLDGPLFLVGGRRNGLILNSFADDEEYLDLYEVHLTSEGAPKTCPLTHVRSKNMGIISWGGFTRTGSFAAGSSVYVSPSGELIVYVSNHDSSGSVAVLGEFRIGSLVRANSPTLRPTASVGGPFVIDEGGSGSLTGQGEPPITKAFVQLFGDTNVGLELTGWPWLAVEHDDRNLDAFDQLDFLGGRAKEIWEEASSWRWFAPPGCTIQANDYPIRSDEFPGPSTVVLRGTGRFEEVLDLSNLQVYKPGDTANPYPVSPVPVGQPASPHNYDDDIEGVTFYEAYRVDGALVSDRRFCNGYYDAPIGLGWDLDGNGSFETAGTSVTFSAASLDGPTAATVQARATHPTDTSPLGTGAPVPVPIEVRNVVPLIGAASVTDPLGYDLDGGARVVIAGLPVNLAVDFTDPGRPDTQTATVDWGDGTPLDTSFASFSDAWNGATGQLRDAHAYTAAGSYSITATITDDDGGATSAEFTIEVLSLEDAIEHVADELTTLIEAASDTRIASALRAARDELIGNVGGDPPTNGALDKLEEDDPVGAITKLRAAISDLITAESSGADDLSPLKDLLGLVAEGIATGAYFEAEAAVSPPSPGQAKTLAAIADLIARGHQQLIDHRYAKACDSFRQATEKALELSD